MLHVALSLSLKNIGQLPTAHEQTSSVHFRGKVHLDQSEVELRTIDIPQLAMSRIQR